MNQVVIRYLGGKEYSYKTSGEIGVGFDAKLGWVSVYVDGDEISHDWDWVGAISTEGEVKLVDVYSP
ncbi:hypothetical protein Dxin01_00192 [Deinococcus xinjiangensis]|uniref:Uncharacterized protein n=1 Tax=Deinococcus xinjiangensis TaxID=457454 RepID=A0ABP9V6Z1_9DEIO